MLDMDLFSKIPPGTTFARGIAKDSLGEINLSHSGMDVKWVAVKGYAEDWCIYVHLADEHTFEDIEKNGDKLVLETNIQRLIPCRADVMKRYRW